MEIVQHLERDVTVLHDAAEVPGLGVLPVNAFVLHAEQPVVIDTGMSLPGCAETFMRSLESVIDPESIRWIWLTHPDKDHTGALFDLMAAAPEARVITTFLGVGIMSVITPLPMDRVYLLNPGQSIDVGDRTLTAFRPPIFDSPATCGFTESRHRSAFTSDCFGAPLGGFDEAGVTDVRDLDDDDVKAGQLLWATVDSPWVHTCDLDLLRHAMEPLRETDPDALFSTHLPPAVGQLDTYLDTLEEAPSATPFVGPDQQALEAMLASFEPSAPEPIAG